MNKLILPFLLIPIIFILMIFILINKNHQKYPDKLVCSSFKVALRKSVPLYVSESIFKYKTDEMCQCFFRSNHQKRINDKIIDICSKETLFEWIMPPEKFKNKDSEYCFKENVYKEIIIPFVTKEQNITFSKGVFKNDILNNSKKEAYERNKVYQTFLTQCNNIK